MAKFKVRRALLAMKGSTFTEGITASSTLDATLGITTASTLDVTLGITGGSTIEMTGGVVASSTMTVAKTLDVTGGLTAASTFTVTGSAIVGSASIALAQILCGSFNITTPDVNASANATATACIYDMGTEGSAYKIFVTPRDIGGSQFVQNVAASADSPSGAVVVTFGNMLDSAAASSILDATFNYLAILDK